MKEAKEAGFTWRTFVGPDTRWPEGEAYLRRVFQGRTATRWTTNGISPTAAFLAKRLIIKSVRANRLLPWICENFDLPSPVLLIRHPCAVVASQLKGDSWRSYSGPDSPPYIDNYPVFKSAVTRADTIEEKLATLWALDQLPPLLAPAPRPWIIVTYEELLIQPEVALKRIFTAWNVNAVVESATDALKKPSPVVHSSGISGIGGWKEQLDDKQISMILNTVQQFGLRFYDKDVEPHVDELNDKALPDHIRIAGTR